MATSGPLYPGTTASLANAPTSENANAWTNPGNVGADDATEAQITAATYDSPDISELLVTSNFGFSVPAGSVIAGITVEIDRRSIIANSGKDFRVQLAKGTTFADLVGSNKAVPATIWPSATAVATYGGGADLWGTTWTPAEVNAASFAVFLSAQANIANADIGVDYIRVTVTYTADTALAGSAAGASSGSGVLATAIRFAGTGAAAATAAAILSTSIALAGLAAGGSTAAGNLATGVALAGAAGGASTAGANLTTAIPLAGVAVGAATAQGALTSTADTALSGAAAGSSTASASLATAIALGGDAAGASGAAGNLTTAIALAGSAPGLAAAAGILGPPAATALVGLAAGTSDAAGILTALVVPTGMIRMTGARVTGRDFRILPSP